MKLLGPFFSARFGRVAICLICFATFFLARNTLGQYVAHRPTSGAPALPSTAKGTPRTRKALPAHGRFLGWKYAQRAGAAYFRRFARPRHGLAIPVRNTSSGSGSTSGAATMLSASSPASPPPLPGFLFRPTLPAGFIPTSVATGDFNGDGRLDWVVSNGGDNNLWLYLGNGDGTSQLPTIIPLRGRSPVWVAAADLRGNGVLDLIVAEADSGTIGVLLGKGDGTFGTETEYSLAEMPLCLLVNDFNGDGHPDVLVGLVGNNNDPDYLAFLPGDGTGGLGAPVYTAPDKNSGEDPKVVLNMAMADLNNDGRPDVVFNDVGGIGGVVVSLNQGDGTFAQPQFVSVPLSMNRAPITEALGDLNGDGCADLIVLDTWGMADRFLGNCDGTFQDTSTYKPFAVGEISQGIALADMNGDGRLDIVTSGVVAAAFTQFYGQQVGRLVSVLLGDGQGNFSPPTVYRGEPGMYSLAVADLKGDGYPDIITANQDTDSVSVYANDGHGGFGPPQGGYIGYYVNGVSTGSINLPFGARTMFADVNGDGKRDISILQGPAGSSCDTCNVIGAVLNQGSGIFDQVIHSDILSTTSSTIISQALANFRNTGLPDLLVTGTDFSTGAPYLSFAPNAGGGKFGTATVTSPAGVNGQIGVGDFNRDGKLDFVAFSGVVGTAPNSVTSKLTVFLGNGSGGFTPGYSTEFNVNSSLGTGNVFVGDFNGDGKLDVLAQETSNLEGTLGHDVYEFLGNGDGTFAAPVVVLTNSGPFSVGDLNHDGRPDIVEQVLPLTTLPSQTPPEYAIYLCQPDGSFKLAHTYEPYAGWTTNYGFDKPFLEDFNGDGNLDILAYQSGGGAENPDEARIYFQIMAGNGDGSFTPTYTIFDVTGDSSPHFAADLTGNGRADLVEIDGYTSSYHVIPAVPGPAMQVRLVSDPVVGSNGSVQLSLAVASSSSTTVNLAASDSAITIPSSVTIPAGSVSLDVPFQIGAGFNPRHVFSIQAQLGTETETAYGTQATHSLGLGLNLQYTSMTVAAGGTTANYNLGVYSMSGYSTNVQLQCSGLPAGATCIFGSAAFAIASGGFRYTSLTVATSSSLAAGTYSFSVVATDGTVSGQTSASVVVQQAPVLEVSPNSVIFPIQTIGTTSAPQTVTLTNVGSATMTLSILTSVSDPNNPDFAQTNNCGASLAVGASCTVNVVFTPTTTGSIGGALEIGANLLGVKTTWVNLSGTAEGPLVQPSPGSLYFNDEYVGAPSAAKTVTLWNVGTVPLSFSSIAVTGADPADFAVAVTGTNCSTSAQLDVGLGCTVNVIFKPTATGRRTATLSIAYNNSSTPQTVSLTGNGRSPDFTLATAPGSPSGATVAPGESATYTIAVTPLGAFTQPISIKCPGEPTMSCSASPASVTLNGTPQDVTIKVSTTAGALISPRGPGPMKMPPAALWTALLALISLAGLVLAPRRRAMLSDSSRRAGRLRARYVLTLGAIMLTVVLWASCGGGNGAGAAPPSPTGTTAGNYSLIIYGYSGNLSHSTRITLLVK